MKQDDDKNDDVGEAQGFEEPQVVDEQQHVEDRQDDESHQNEEEHPGAEEQQDVDGHPSSFNEHQHVEEQQDADKTVHRTIGSRIEQKKSSKQIRDDQPQVRSCINQLSRMAIHLLQRSIATISINMSNCIKMSTSIKSLKYLKSLVGERSGICGLQTIVVITTTIEFCVCPLAHMNCLMTRECHHLYQLAWNARRAQTREQVKTDLDEGLIFALRRTRERSEPYVIVQVRMCTWTSGQRNTQCP